MSSAEVLGFTARSMGAMLQRTEGSPSISTGTAIYHREFEWAFETAAKTVLNGETTSFTLSGFSITDPEVTPITVNLSASGTLSETTFQGTLSEVISSLNSYMAVNSPVCQSRSLLNPSP